MLFSPRNVALLCSIFGFATAQETCAYSTVTVTASLATASTSTVTIDTVYVTVTASASTTTTSICDYVAPPPPPPAATYVSTVVEDIYVTNQVTVTDLQIVDVVTQVSTKVDVVTLQSFYTAPPCALVPAFSNSNFASGYDNWDVVVPDATYTNDTDSVYTENGPLSIKLGFPSGSSGVGYTDTNQVIVSQRVEICPGKPYDFAAYATTGLAPPNSGTCHFMLCLDPDVGKGVGKCSASMRLFAPETTPTVIDDWVKASVSFDNLDLTSNYVTASIHAICGAGSQDYVYVDSIEIVAS